MTKQSTRKYDIPAGSYGNRFQLMRENLWPSNKVWGSGLSTYTEVHTADTVNYVKKTPFWN